MTPRAVLSVVLALGPLAAYEAAPVDPFAPEAPELGVPAPSPWREVRITGPAAALARRPLHAPAPPASVLLASAAAAALAFLPRRRT
jgi:hypothetical protein